ncbi:transposase [Chryseobacterium sp. RR2-3-20]|uniref:transposase n=1 Tax=Chryseobacterium sp. RR2-3-20 TaxID=2787626 RepID=UPI001FD863BD|nr:transposase [Chryseobacterium sp. RR2-3-20]
MWNIDAVLFTEWKNGNEKHFKIILINRHNRIDCEAIFQDFTVFFSYEFGFDSEDEIHRNYRYSAYITNQEQSATDVWRTYRNRGDAENRIKELKADFGAESFNLKGFFPTEAALIFSMIAYNLMSIFRLFVLQEKTQKTLSTLRYRTFAIGAYFEKVGDTLKLKIALTKKRRKWFVGIWDYPIDLSQKISTA